MSSCKFSYFPFWFRGQDFGSHCTSSCPQLSFYFLATRLIYEPRSEKTGLRGFRAGAIQTGLSRSDTNRTVQPQKMARGLKFRI